MNNELLNSYFAGLIDGEGNMNVYNYGKSEKKRPVIKVHMTCKKTIIKLQEYFGGSIYTKKTDPKHKIQYGWIVTFKNANKVALAIKPYLITKSDNADLIINYYKNK